MIINKIKFFLCIISIIILSGCSTRQVEIDKSSDCLINPNWTFIVKPVSYEGLNKINANNLPNGNIMRIASYTKGSLKKYFPNSLIMINSSYNPSSSYSIFIKGFYKTYTYNSVEPLIVFHAPQYFSGFTSNGTYYYGSTGMSSSTAWIPTREKGIIFLVNVDVFDNNSIHLLHCEMSTHDASDLSSKDWIDDCMKKLTSCKKQKTNLINN